LHRLQIERIDDETSKRSCEIETRDLLDGITHE
jgi:hypothetical protein